VVIKILWWVIVLVEGKEKVLKNESAKKSKIEVVIINEPSKEERVKKINQLSEYLSKVWELPNNS